MTGSLLVQFSDALSALIEQSRGFLAEVHSDNDQAVNGVLWRNNAVVVSEQALPGASEYEVKVDGRLVKAHLAGRDEGTNVAALRLEDEFAAKLPGPGAPRLGTIALILGAGANGPTAKLAIVRSLSGPWESLKGGTIDHRITLDTRIGAAEEGGPVLDAQGTILGISTRGAGGQSLVIPTSTVDRAVTALLEKGGVERGWLGVALRPVALPEVLRPQESQRVGLMVMEVGAGSPAAQAGILAGDIVLSAGGVPATRFGKIARQLGSSSIGTKIAVVVARAGSVITNEVTIAARKS